MIALAILAALQFHDVQVLKPEEVMPVMRSLRAALGAKCAACHDVTNRNYASDAKKEKVRAREMMRMNAEIVERTFKGEPRVGCWTCHRGGLEPPKVAPFARELPQGFPPLAGEDLEKPAGQVFKDVRQLRGVDARNFGLIMGWFTRELGVKCAYCHAEGGFDAPTPRKDRAREMLQMTSYVADEYYKGDSPIGCGTCHRGEPIPLTAPGRRAK